MIQPIPNPFVAIPVKMVKWKNTLKEKAVAGLAMSVDSIRYKHKTCSNEFLEYFLQGKPYYLFLYMQKAL